MKKIIKLLLYIFLALIIAFALFLLYSTITDYTPEEKEILQENKASDVIDKKSEISLMLWNIGYCGLNKEMDFFYDGGKKVRPSEQQVLKNIEGVKSYLAKNDNIDFIMLQEVDKHSKRSYYTNQFDTISNLFNNKYYSFAKNYDVFFVPTPPTDPMGKVKSGLMTISKYKAKSSVRYSFPGNYDWPTNLFMLDRCFMVNRYDVTNDKELLIINTHNSAYDDGDLKKQQMEFLKKFIRKEYKKGNYVVVGGDWNQCPPNYKANFKENIQDNENRTDIEISYMKGYKWLFNNEIPTSRRVKTPYLKGKTLTTVIDFYLVSPNIKSVSIENINLGFEFSDHQPVKAIIKLKR